MARKPVTPKHIKKARSVNELWTSLENISNDDRRAIEDYTQEEVVEEARYVLSLYFEGGTCSREELLSDDPEISKPAKRQVRMLQKYIRMFEVNSEKV